MTESVIQTQVNPAELDGLAQLQAMRDGLIPAAPIAETLGFAGFDVPERGTAIFELDPELRHYNPIGSVHGGVYATLLDSACGCAVHSTLAVGEGYTSLDLTVKFLRAVTVDSGRLRAVGTVLQRGRRTALAEAKLYDGSGKLVAYASSSCMIFS
ncbi:PaaI family thioesterase [Nocardioides sp. WV_118_6]|uniref:PaaI family thioesterase n=1 Tax=Nocardioides simplex TaxID=2045 RepID=UPI0021501B95|nr:PaaI family thioesterase [Pimelobacter simplex]UUW92608.1 PaaI family thioesterase [Pimelobacter simplex]UUW96435.1 PaaI family thioesterase [Pimelobacter simplex]